MKKTAFLILLLSGFFSCTYNVLEEGDEETPILHYEATVMSRTDFENAIQIQSPQSVINAGKIYIYNQFVWISDRYEGFHIYRYNEANVPIPIAFVNAPGATDVAIKNNVFYINQAVDLLTLQFNSDFSEITHSHRIRNVFAPLTSPLGGVHNASDNEVIVNWKLIN